MLFSLDFGPLICAKNKRQVTCFKHFGLSPIPRSRQKRCAFFVGLIALLAAFLFVNSTIRVPKAHFKTHPNVIDIFVL